MEELHTLLMYQHQAEQRHSEFLSSLHTERTATLLELLLGNKTALERLQATWLDLNLLRRILARMSSFFEEVERTTLPGFRRLPLLILQASPLSEDADELTRRLLRGPACLEKYRGLPPHIFYLHTQTNFSAALHTDPLSQLRIIPPLQYFTSTFSGRSSGAANGSLPIIGYRIPNYPELLCVTPDLATAYLARIIVHDFGHFFFPRVGLTYEELHNVMMILAMGMEETDIATSNPWESLIHKECADPYFFLEASRYLDIYDATELSPTQRFIAGRYRALYLEDFARYRETIWKLTQDMDTSEKRRLQVQKIIQEFRTQGFQYPDP